MAKGKQHGHYATGKKAAKKRGEKERSGQQQSSHLKFRGETLEIAPTAERPVVVLVSEQYETWISGITDVKTNTAITYHVDKMRRGLFGDWKPVTVVVLLGGGDKGSQKDDIAAAQNLWEEMKNEITQV